MYVGRHQLVGGAPIIYYTLLKFRTDFVIQYLHTNLMSLIIQALHNGVIGSYPVFVFPVREWCLKNGIQVTMICYNNVVVATPGSNRKVATIIIIQLTDWLITNM